MYVFCHNVGNMYWGKKKEVFHLYSVKKNGMVKAKHVMEMYGNLEMRTTEKL